MNDLEQACARLIRDLQGEVVAFSVPHKAALQHVGLPDFRVRLRGAAFWAEIKGPADKLTQPQLDFLKAEHTCGQIVFAGGLEALQRMVLRRPTDWYAIGWKEVAVVAFRGIRA